MIRGRQVLALVAIVLAALATRATEVYATRYQTLPVMDWLESRPPLTDAAALPAAADLARGLERSMPLLVVREDAHSRLPVFGPPAYVQRTIGGVRDAARMELGTPGTFGGDGVPVRARLDVIVFNRAVRAAAWAELMGREMDIRDPESGAAQVRLAGPDEPNGVWLIAPRAGGGVATVAGSQGPIGYALQVTFARTTDDPAALADLSARAEAAARRAATDWSAWLAQQLAA